MTLQQLKDQYPILMEGFKEEDYAPETVALGALDWIKSRAIRILVNGSYPLAPEELIDEIAMLDDSLNI